MDLSAFQSALQALHFSQDRTVRNEANDWLKKCQEKFEAWAFADTILRNPSSSMDELFWCAQTLKVKVHRDFEELPPGTAPQLRESLVQHLLRFHKTQPTIRTQLCLALAATVTTMPPEHWGAPPGSSSGGNPVRWFAERFNRETPDVALPCMLELMAVLPQEIGSSKILVRPQQRKAATQDLRACIGDALTVLATCLQQAGPDVKAAVLAAFASWLKFSGGSVLAQSLGALLASNPLVQLALDGLTDTAATFDSSVNACVEIVWSTVKNGEVLPEMQGLASVLVQRVMDLLPRFSLCRERAQAERDGKDPDDVGGGEDAQGLDDDDETVKAMAWLFVEVGEAFYSMIATGSPEVMRPVEALLEVAAHPDDAICSMSFNFWSRLTRAIMGTRDGPQSMDDGGMGVGLPAGVEIITFTGGPRTLSPDEVRRRINVFTPVLERLVVLVMGRARYPEDFSDMSKDERVDWREGRYAIADVLNDVNQVLGFERLLQILMEPLQRVTSAVQAGHPFDWRVAEACLYCIRGVNKCVPVTASSPFLLQLMASLPGLPQSEPKLIQTAALLVGSYADWIVQQQQGALITELLQMLCNFILVDEASTAASLAISHLCDAGRGKLAPILPELLQLYTRVLPAGSVRLLLPAEQSAVIPSSIREEDVGNIIQACANVMASLDATEAATEALSAALTPTIQVLQQALDQAMANAGASGASAAPSGTLRTAFYAALDRIARLFKHFYGGDKAAAGRALQGITPLLIRSLRQSSGDGDAAEHVGRAARYAIKCSGTLAAPSLSPLLEAMAQAFSVYRYPSVLFVVSEVVKIFASDPATTATLTTAVSSLIATSAVALRTLRDIENRPDLADDLLLLALRCLSYAPRTVAAPETLREIYMVASHAVLAMHREAQRSAVNVLAAMFRGEGLDDAMKTAVASFVAVEGSDLVRRLLGGAIGYLPDNFTPGLAEVLEALLRFTNGAAGTWLLASLDAMPPGVMTKEDLNSLQQLVIGLASACNVRACTDVLYGISDVLGRNRKVQDAAITVLLPGQTAIPGPPPA